MRLLRFAALALLALLLVPAAGRASSNADLVVAWSEMPQTCDGIAGFKARFGTATAYAGPLAALSKKLGCGKKPITKKPLKRDEQSGQKTERRRSTTDRQKPPPRSQPIVQYNLGVAAEARGETQTARFYYHDACMKGLALACNKAALSFYSTRDYDQSRFYHENSCRFSSPGDSNRKIYCANASLVYRDPGYGPQELAKSARYFLDSETTILEFSPACRASLDQCEALLNGLADPSQPNFTKARELAEWLCWYSTNLQMAARSCNRGVILLSTTPYLPRTQFEFNKAVILADRGCNSFGNTTSCWLGLWIAGSNQFGVQNPQQARKFFENPGYQPTQIDCKLDASVCDSLGLAYSLPATYGAANYQRAIVFLTNACNAGSGRSCISAASIYERPSTGMANARRAQELRAKAATLGCTTYNPCPRSASGFR